MKKIAMKFAAAGLVLLFSPFAQAEYHFDFTPSVSVREMYDDNIFLAPDHEESDYITTVFLRLKLNIVGQHTRLGVRYRPTLAWYDYGDDKNTIRHTGNITFNQKLSEYLRFDLSDTYVKSEEPLEETEDIEGVRHTRNTYQRNRGRASFKYTFGPGNDITVGFRHSLLENEDPTIDDGRIHTPFATATLWLDVRNGLGFSYSYKDASFSRDDGNPPDDDYTGHSTGIQYIYRFNPHQRCSVGYTLTTRNFDGTTEDYKIHEGNVSYLQKLSPDFSVTLGAGYFKQDNDRSSDTTGFSYNASIKKRFHRGTVIVGGAGGWNEAYLEAERRGFSRYRSLNARVQYQLLAPLTGYAAGSYRHDKDDSDRKWNTYRADCGLRWAFLRWFTAELGYRYARRDDDVDADDYTDNQVMLTLTAGRLFRW